MKLNPVFEKELKQNSRSSRISWIIFGCNLLLAVTAIVCYFGESGYLGYLAPVSYSTPVNCYILMEYLLLLLVLFSVPAVAGSSISQEREKKTLDVLLTTRLNPWRIITGKLQASLGVVFILAVSSMPVVSLILAFGGIGIGGMLLMAVALLVTGIWIGSIGIFCSVVFKKTTLAVVMSYLFVLLLTAGTIAAVALAYYFGVLRQSMGTYETVETGKTVYLLLLNPLVSFAGMLSYQFGTGHEIEQLCNLLGNYSGSLVMHHMPVIGTVLQLICSAILLVLAGRKLNPLNR